MTLKEIYNIADEIAPKRLSDEACQKYGYYDNSGVLVDTGSTIESIVFSLDCSLSAIERAKNEKANLLITHHPAIYGGVGNTITQDTNLGNKLIECIKNGISVISMHLNLDFVKDGIDESLMAGICRSVDKTDGVGTHSTEIMQEVDGGGYGRVYNVEGVSLGALTNGIKKEFRTDKVLFYGEKDREITRIASFCGAGADEATIRFAKEKNADVIISSDFKHHLLALAQEEGMAVIVLTHYASESYGFEKFYKKICQRVNIPCYYHKDEHLL